MSRKYRSSVRNFHFRTSLALSFGFCAWLFLLHHLDPNHHSPSFFSFASCANPNETSFFSSNPIKELDIPSISVDMLEVESPILSFDFLTKGGLIMTTLNGQVLYSPSQSNITTEILKNGVRSIHIHPYYDDIYVLEYSQMHLLKSGEASFQLYPLPGNYDIGNPPLQLNYEERELLLFSGTRSQSDPPGSAVHTFYSINSGKDWHYLMHGLSWCVWARTKQFTLVPKSAILCLLGSRLVYSETFFQTHQVLLTNTLKFAVYGEYLLAMVSDSTDPNASAHLYVSLDAQYFGMAMFPGGKNEANRAYTVLPAHKGALFVDIPSFQTGQGGIGCLYKSNLNGTRFTPIRNSTFRSTQPTSNGLVDLETLESIPGFMFVNIVSNPDQVKDNNAIIAKQTMFSKDDGSTWQPLMSAECPSQASAPTSIHINPQDSSCRLHLHLYLERTDNQDVMDAKSAPGLFLALGNIGSSLTSMNEANTYVTRDAGKTWHEVKKGPHQFEFGDHGSILFLIHASETTTQAFFSFDDGATFQSLSLSSDPFKLKHIYTHPNATREKFIVTGSRVKDNKEILFFIDFSRARNDTCKLDPKDTANSDFEAWSISEECLLGKKTTYFRRKSGKTCAIRDVDKLYAHEDKICLCTKNDFECDFNFVSNEAGECVPLYPTDQVCDGKTYWFPSGYRKRSSTSCSGGLMLDQLKSYTCSKGHSFFFWMVLLFIFTSGGYVFILIFKRIKSSGIEIRFPGSDFISDFVSDLRYRFQYRRVETSQQYGTSLMNDD